MEYACCRNVTLPVSRVSPCIVTQLLLNDVWSILSAIVLHVLVNTGAGYRSPNVTQVVGNSDLATGSRNHDPKIWESWP